MKIACLKHVTYEGPAYLPDWATRHGHSLAEYLVPETGLPPAHEFDRVIIIGGPMSVWETNRHAWLSEEKRYLASLVGDGIPVLGICLGAQLLAEHLGATVKAGELKEIGWFPLETHAGIKTTWLGGALPERFESFFWHGDYFDLPDGAVPVARSAAHEVQGFVYGPHLALQFHLEATPHWAERLARRDAHELIPAPFVQTAEEIIGASPDQYRANHRLLEAVLGRWAG
jgi:GMP synthase-like glutamine amidotransferase